MNEPLITIETDKAGKARRRFAEPDRNGRIFEPAERSERQGAPAEGAPAARGAPAAGTAPRRAAAPRGRAQPRGGGARRAPGGARRRRPGGARSLGGRDRVEAGELVGAELEI